MVVASLDESLERVGARVSRLNSFVDCAAPAAAASALAPADGGLCGSRWTCAVMVKVVTMPLMDGQQRARRMSCVVGWLLLLMQQHWERKQLLATLAAAAVGDHSWTQSHVEVRVMGLMLCSPSDELLPARYGGVAS